MPIFLGSMVYCVNSYRAVRPRRFTDVSSFRFVFSLQGSACVICQRKLAATFMFHTGAQSHLRTQSVNARQLTSSLMPPIA